MSAEKQCILKIKGLTKQYENSQHNTLNDFNLEIYEEDFLCILGPSGCGKSTLIRCVAGFEEYSGSIELNGHCIKRPGPDRIMVFQDFNQLFPWKTVLGNLVYALKTNKIGESMDDQIHTAEVYLEKVSLLEYKDYYPHQLSGGMKQRVAIARGMALGSVIMLMDEPFAALDAITRNQMEKELVQIKETEHMTILFITHNIQEAISLGNKILVMSGNGHIKELLDNPIQRPITPASAGYGELWTHLNTMLTEERNLST